MLVYCIRGALSSRFSWRVFSAAMGRIRFNGLRFGRALLRRRSGLVMMAGHPRQIESNALLFDLSHGHKKCTLPPVAGSMTLEWECEARSSHVDSRRDGLGKGTPTGSEPVLRHAKEPKRGDVRRDFFCRRTGPEIAAKPTIQYKSRLTTRFIYSY